METTIEKKTTVEIVSFAPSNITIFETDVAICHEIVAIAEKVLVNDISDKTQIEAVTSCRIKLMRARKEIERKGKEYREDALAFQRAVIKKEKELLAILEPQEKRLSEIEKSAKEYEEKQKEKERLEVRKVLFLEKFGVPLSHEEEKTVAPLSDVAFSFFIQSREAKIKMEEIEKQRQIEIAEMKKREAERAELERIENEKRMAQKAIEDARLAEELKKIEAERAEIKAKEDAIARAKAEIERQKIEEEKAKIEAQRIEDEKKRQAEIEQKRNEFVAWRATFGYTEETKNDYLLQDDGTHFTLYRKLGSFNK